MTEDTPYEYHHNAPDQLPSLLKVRWGSYKKLRSLAETRYQHRRGLRSWGDLGVLTEAEHELLFASTVGIHLQLRRSTIPGRKTDLKVAGDHRRQVSADLLAWIVTDREARSLLCEDGILCKDSMIVGETNISNVKLPELSISIIECVTAGSIIAIGATLKRLSLEGSKVHPSAYTAAYSHGSGSESELGPAYRSCEYVSKAIARHPDFSGIGATSYMRLIPFKEMRSIAARGIVVEDDILCNRHFAATGPVDFDSCKTGGSIDVSDGNFLNDTMADDYVPALSIAHGVLGENLRATRCIVDGVTHLDRIRVSGGIDFRGAKLNYLRQKNHAAGECPEVSRESKRIGSYRAAVTLLAADIGGSVDMSSAPARGKCYEHSLDGTGESADPNVRTEVDGGIRLRLCKIGGDLKLHSASIKAKYFRSAIDATGVNVKGSVRAQKGRNHRLGMFPFEAEGNIRFRSAKIAGEVDFSSAKIKNRRVDAEGESTAIPVYPASSRDTSEPAEYAPAHTWSLDLRNARIGSRVTLDGDFVADKGVCIRSARIKDRVSIQGVKDGSGDLLGCDIQAPDIRFHPNALGRAIDAFRVRIGGSFYLDGPNAKIRGRIDFSLAQINGRFGIGRRAVYSKEKVFDNTGSSGYLREENLVERSVPDHNPHGRWLSIQPTKPAYSTDAPTSLSEIGALSLQHAQIGFELVIGPPTIREPADDQEMLVENPIFIGGRVNAIHAEIGYQVYLGRATFREMGRAPTTIPPNGSRGGVQKITVHPGGSSERSPGVAQFNAAIDFTAARIGLDFYIDGSLIYGGICLDSIAITQDLVLRRGIAYSMLASRCLCFPVSSCGKWESEAVYETGLIRQVFGEGLRKSRHNKETWAVSLRHATIKRNLSIRSDFLAFGGLMVLRSAIDGYLELCDLSKASYAIVAAAEKRVRTIGCKISDTVSVSTWLLHLSGSYAGVVWWDLSRSGVVLEGGEFTTDDQLSLKGLLSLNDFQYKNIWFSLGNEPDGPKHEVGAPPRVVGNDASLGPKQDEADKTPVMVADGSSGGWKACKAFLDLQRLPTDEDGPDFRSGFRNKGSKPSMGRAFRPQPYEQLASVCRAHGRSDLFSEAHIEKLRQFEASLGSSAGGLARLVFCGVVYFSVAMLLYLGAAWTLIPSEYFCIGTMYFLFLAPFIAYLLWALLFRRYAAAIQVSDFAYRYFGPAGRFLQPDRKRIKYRDAVRWVFLKHFGFFAGYGYRPGRILAIASILVVVGGIFSSHAHRLGVLRSSAFIGDRVAVFEELATSSVAGTDRSSTHTSPLGLSVLRENELSSDYPSFNGFWYAADKLIPVIGLEQSDYWQPYPFSASNEFHADFIVHARSMSPREIVGTSGWSTGFGFADSVIGWGVVPVWRSLSMSQLPRYETVESHSPRRWAGWASLIALLMFFFGPIYTVVGWVLVTMGIASATRLVKHD